MVEIQQQVKLQRRVKIWQAVAFILGLVIGSAIYISPSVVLAGAGSPGVAMLIWALAGAQAVIGSLCYAELGTTFPVSGDKYYYLEKMYGPSVSFCYLWMYTFFRRPAANAIKALTFGKYALQLVFPECEIPDSAVRILGVLMAALIMMANIIQVEWSNRGQAFFSFLSVASLFCFSTVGIVYLARGDTWAWEGSFSGTSSHAGDIVLASYAAIYAYVGWHSLNSIIEEVQNPKRNVPLAIYCGLFLVTVFYVLTNVAYITVLGKERLLQSEAVAVVGQRQRGKQTHREKDRQTHTHLNTPINTHTGTKRYRDKAETQRATYISYIILVFQTFAQHAFPVAAWLVPVFVCLSNISSYNVSQLLSSRLSFVAARRGHFPKLIGLITTWSYSPITSLIMQFIFTSAAILSFDISALIKHMMFLSMLYEALAVIGMIRFRWTKPELERPYKVHIAIPITYLMTQIFLLVVPLVTRPGQTMVAVVFSLGTSIPVYIIFIRKKWRPKKVSDALDWITTVTQKLLLCVPQEAKYDW